MVDWLAGNRVRGTSTERASGDFNNHLTGAGAVGGWKELGRTTLGSSGDSISVSSLPDKRYYMLLGNHFKTGAIAHALQMNGDTGTSYSNRCSINGGSDFTNISRTRLENWGAGNTNPDLSVSYISNLSSKEKLVVEHLIDQNTSGAGNAPARRENVGKWANTTNAINELDSINYSTGDFTSGSELVVLGWDPSDTHTTNFWEELADVDVTTGTTISTGNFTAKKYLWVQFYLNASAISFDWQFNSSTDTQTSTYSGRHQNNGIGASGQNSDYTQINKNVMAENFGLNASPHFGNMFIVNNASNEKLVTGHLVNQNTATAGYAPNRAEFAYKWANTTNQINNITMLNSVNVSRFIMKVWGAN